MSFMKDDVVQLRTGELVEEVVIFGDYTSQFGSPSARHDSIYTIQKMNGGRFSWHDEENMTFVRHEDGLYEKIEEKRREQETVESDFRWIYENWAAMKEKGEYSFYSLQSLYSKLGQGSLWGKHGEGMDLYYNMEVVISIFNVILLEEKISFEEFVSRLDEAENS